MDWIRWDYVDQNKIEYNQGTSKMTVSAIMKAEKKNTNVNGCKLADRLLVFVLKPEIWKRTITV